MLDRPSTTQLADAPPIYSQPLPANVEDAVVLIGRIIIGQLFLVSGFWKMLGLSAFGASLAARGVPTPQALAVLGACGEFFGGLALLLGFKTRWAALVLVLFTIVATGISHRYWEFSDAAVRRSQEANFYKNVAIIGGLFYAFAIGGGRFGIDGLWRGRRTLG